jgi:hypothetical protein
MSGKVFISYRRGEDSASAGRLCDSLLDAFDPNQVFMDVDNIDPGMDFFEVLEEKVAQSDVLLAVIGKRWVDAIDAKGNRRLADPTDFVRIEIEAALKQNKRVIPVLVDDAEMPAPDQLPESLRPLARRQALRVKHERYRSDADGLIRALRKILDRPGPEARNTDERLRRLANELGREPAGQPVERPPAESPAPAASQQITVEPPAGAPPADASFADELSAARPPASPPAATPLTDKPLTPQATDQKASRRAAPESDGRTAALLAQMNPASQAGAPTIPSRMGWAAWPATIGGLVILTGALVFFWLARDRPTLDKPAMETALKEKAPAPLPDRVDRSSSSAPAIVPQRVVLYDEDPSDPKGKQYVGSAIWRTEQVKPAAGQKADIAVRADIEIPDRKFKMTMSFRRNTDITLPASHTMEITFILPPDFAGGGVGNVPGILMKSNEQARGARHAAGRPRRQGHRRLLPGRAVECRRRPRPQPAASEGAFLVRHCRWSTSTSAAPSSPSKKAPPASARSTTRLRRGGSRRWAPRRLLFDPFRKSRRPWPDLNAARTASFAGRTV